MVNQSGTASTAARVLRWTARVWGVLSLAFMAVMVGGEVIFPHAPFPTPLEMLGMLFFPVGVCAGIVVAWWREGLGGAISVGSMIVFYILLYFMRGQFPRGPYFALVAAPGVLFLLSWVLTARQRSSQTT
jgi:hypothetical protein